jgi:hypothetical protein
MVICTIIHQRRDEFGVCLRFHHSILSWNCEDALLLKDHAEFLPHQSSTRLQSEKFLCPDCAANSLSKVESLIFTGRYMFLETMCYLKREVLSTPNHNHSHDAPKKMTDAQTRKGAGAGQRSSEWKRSVYLIRVLSLISLSLCCLRMGHWYRLDDSKRQQEDYGWWDEVASGGKRAWNQVAGELAATSNDLAIKIKQNVSGWEGQKNERPRSSDVSFSKNGLWPSQSIDNNDSAANGGRPWFEPDQTSARRAKTTREQASYLSSSRKQNWLDSCQTSMNGWNERQILPSHGHNSPRFFKPASASAKPSARRLSSPLRSSSAMSRAESVLATRIDLPDPLGQFLIRPVRASPRQTRRSLDTAQRVRAFTTAPSARGAAASSQGAVGATAAPPPPPAPATAAARRGSEPPPQGGPPEGRAAAARGANASPDSAGQAPPVRGRRWRPVQRGHERRDEETNGHRKLG